ncbi:UNVERIFIED_CONTAM: hypothetical protein PYX00_010164 [Menopon gallinae]|uniref:Uncharacterized protein n=1 Tax=Menopon gallinae TaxID=328185 RepID=A0AAW2HEG2_9NEOP
MLCHFPGIFLVERLRSEKLKRSHTDVIVSGYFIPGWSLSLATAGKCRDWSPERKRWKPNERASRDEKMDVDRSSSDEDDICEVDDMRMDYEAESWHHEGMDVSEVSAELVQLPTTVNRRRNFCARKLGSHPRKRKWSWL